MVSIDSSIQHGIPNSSDINNITIERNVKIPLPPRHKSRITFTLEEAVDYELKHRRQVGPDVDMKQLRRTISNRLSALRSRTRKSQYVKEMEKMIKDLEDKVSVLTPQIEILENHRKQLQLENDSLQKRIQIRSNEARISKTLLEQKQLEICWLKEVEQTMNVNSHGQHQTASHQPYSIELYKNGLRQFEANPLREEQCCSSAVVQLEEDEDIDQYLNFEELNLDPPCVCD